jgi:hypothetical protein
LIGPEGDARSGFAPGEEDEFGSPHGSRHGCGRTTGDPQRGSMKRSRSSEGSVGDSQGGARELEHTRQHTVIVRLNTTPEA